MLFRERKASYKIASCIVLLSFIALNLGCGGDDSPTDSNMENPEEKAFNGISVARTSSLTLPIVAIHEDGDRLAVMTNAAQDKVEGAVYTPKNGDALTVWTRDDGLPSMAHINDHIILFENYEGNKVDAAVIQPDGNIAIHRDLQIQANSMNKYVNKSASQASLSLSEAMRGAGLAISVAGCIGAIILSAGVALPCGAALVSVALALVEANNPALEESSAAFGVFASAVGCTSGQVLPCVGFVVDLAAAVVSDAEDSVEQEQDAINSAKNQLENTPLPGEFQVDGNTVALWHFNEGSGNIVTDESNNSYSGNIIGGEWVPAGRYNSALFLDFSDYVDIDDDIDLGSEFTIEAWVKPDMNPPVRQLQTIVAKYENDFDEAKSYYYGISFLPNGNINIGGEVGSSNSQFDFDTGKSWDTDWHNVSIVFENRTVSAYLDGIFVGQETVGSTTVPNTDQSTWIGARGHGTGGFGSRLFRGTVDEIRISSIVRDPSTESKTNL